MLYKEYLAQHPSGYSRSRFNNTIHIYLRLSRSVMHIGHKAGDKIYIDFAGSKLSVDPQEGMARDAEVFVAIPGL
ncbi:transposase [Pedobacter cryoconitis]|uniref:hypothetical protein n=1 Tax=Pedobacter cryoconitis TaxID=188932 RepID=UPI00161BCFB6|nr:hypothetical protein [Pedobacter cryoconitis]MBB6274064.1 transposase [Pedobacter cryoconitis]